MLKNRFFSIFAVAGLVSLAACGGTDEGADVTVEETTPAVDATAPEMEPMAPVVTDTAVIVDSATIAPTDTAVDAPAQP